MLNIFPNQELTQDEEVLLKEIFSNPTVEKYLRMIAYHAGQTIVAGIPSLTDPDDLFRRKMIFQQGQLAVIELLLQRRSSTSSSSNSN